MELALARADGLVATEGPESALAADVTFSYSVRTE